MTLISDLSPEDMEKVRCLAHIELSITFDENGIHLKTLRPAKTKNINGEYMSCASLSKSCTPVVITEEQLFGVPLTVLLQNDLKRDPKTTIPLLFQEVRYSILSFALCNASYTFVKMIEYLEGRSIKEEGILRVPGSTQRIKVLKCSCYVVLSSVTSFVSCRTSRRSWREHTTVENSRLKEERPQTLHHS